jgi:hypothetical protein
VDINSIVLSVVIVVLLIDKWATRISASTEREEYQAAFREGGRNYTDGYKLAFREFKKRDWNDEAES